MVLYTWQQRAPLGQPVDLAKSGNWRKGLRVADHRRVAIALAEGRYVSPDHKQVTMKQKGVARVPHGPKWLIHTMSLTPLFGAMWHHCVLFVAVLLVISGGGGSYWVYFL